MSNISENDIHILRMLWDANEVVFKAVLYHLYGEQHKAKLDKLFKSTNRDTSKFKVSYNGGEIFPGKRLSKAMTACAIFKAYLKQYPATTLKQLQDAFLAGIDNAVSEIGKNISAKSDTRAKAKSIHDWICRNNSYNYSQTTNHKKDHDPVSFAYLAAHSAYSAIIADDEYQPLCEGYAAAFQLLCHEFGVPCISVAGGANFSGTHVWNYVQLEDGKWYLVDATSDDVEKNGVAYVHQLFLATQGQVAKYAYEPFPYLFSGVNPENGYTEGAEFTFPELVK